MYTLYVQMDFNYVQETGNKIPQQIEYAACNTSIEPDLWSLFVYNILMPNFIKPFYMRVRRSTIKYPQLSVVMSSQVQSMVLS